MQNEIIYRRAYGLVFNQVKGDYKNFGKEFVKAQIMNNGNEDKYFTWFTNSKTGKELLRLDKTMAWQGAGMAINDIIDQIFKANRTPDQLAYDNPIQIRLFE
jgi:hypothetical protein